jgi:ribonuclease D
MTNKRSETSSPHLDFVIPSSLDIRHSSFSRGPIATAAKIAELVEQMEDADRVAVDTEADSLHCYREKLCLLQVSVPGRDYVVDPLAGVAGPAFSGQPLQSEQRDRISDGDRRGWAIQPVQPTGCPPGAERIDIAPLCAALERKEIVLHGADFDLRLLRRSLNFAARRIFDTVIAARLLGIREFSLAALVKRYFGVELGKGSQKANWARRPLPARMLEYAINDTHYLLPLAERLESQLKQCDRMDWLRQSCQRAIEQATVERVRDEDEVWRVRGSASLRGRAAAVLRALWQWREKEAEAADRPPFHILQNHELLNAAVSFASEKLPDYRHFSSRRRQAFRAAAQSALQSRESEWPVSRRRSGTRPSAEMIARTEELRRRRDRAAMELDLEPSFIAPRSTLGVIAADQTRATTLLVPWQRAALGF